MKKKHRSAQRTAPPSSALITPSIADRAGPATTGPFMLFGSGYQTAANSVNRGYIYWPDLSTRTQLRAPTRIEISRRIQWLYAHFGFARKLIRGMARMLGYLTPQPDTSDDEWNELAFSAFMAVARSVEIFDAGGRFDFFESQIQDNIAMFRDGDQLCVLTSTPSDRARFAYYESSQIHNGTRTTPDWLDGVLINRNGRHLGYNIRDGADPDHYSYVDARDSIYMGNFENRGQVRPLSVLHAAVLNMIDVVQTRGFTKTSIKNSSRIGVAVETDSGQARSPTGAFNGHAYTAEAIMPDGTTGTMTFEAVTAGIQNLPLQPGQRVKVITDERPSPNVREFERALLEDCCNTVDLSYQRLCDLSAVTGPGLRLLNQDDKRWITLGHLPQARRCNRQYVYILAKEMKAGRLRYPRLPAGEAWWDRTVWLGLPHPDIDGGRTAAATLTDLRSGLTTWMDEWGEQGGVYWKARIRQSIAEYVYARVQCAKAAQTAGLDHSTITPERIFPERYAPATGTPSQQPPPTTAATPAENAFTTPAPTPAE